MEIPMVYRIMFIAAVIGAYLLSQRYYAFDTRQRLKIYVGFFVIVLLGLIIGYHAIEALVDFFKSRS